MRFFLLKTLLILVLYVQSYSDNIESVLSSLDSDSREKILELLSTAESSGLPVNLLERKLFEGVSKGVSGQLIYQVMKKRLDKLDIISSTGKELERDLSLYEKKKSKGKISGRKEVYVYGKDINEFKTTKKKKIRRGSRPSEDSDAEVKKINGITGSDPAKKIDNLGEKQPKLEKKHLEEEQKLKDKIERKLLMREKKASKLEKKMNKKRK